MPTAVMTLTPAPEPMPIQVGDELKSFRGEWWEFLAIERMPEPGRDGKVKVRHITEGYEMTFYLSVFPGLELRE